MRTIKTNLLTIFICSLFAFTGQAVANSSRVEITPQEAEILSLTNKERENAGLKPLTINSHLMEVARAQSASMAHERDLSHSVKGRDLVLRIKTSGYPYRHIAENVAVSTYPANHVVNMWMESEGHSMNILNSNYEEMGIGITVTPGGDKYYTQVFGARK